MWQEALVISESLHILPRKSIVSTKINRNVSYCLHILTNLYAYKIYKTGNQLVTKQKETSYLIA